MPKLQKISRKARFHSNLQPIPSTGEFQLPCNEVQRPARCTGYPYRCDELHRQRCAEPWPFPEPKEPAPFSYEQPRSEERRVGKECRSRRVVVHSQNNKQRRSMRRIDK